VRAGQQVQAASTDKLVQLGWPVRLRTHGASVVRHFGHEPIAAARHRFDEGLRTLAIAEHLAQRRHMNCQDAFLDERFRPDAGEELILRHQAARMLEKRREQVEGLRHQSDGRCSRRQATFAAGPA
jgi:hypothetical protein